jgi:alanyl-tRNA synthetase
MQKLSSSEIRKRFIDFFVKHNHTEIKSSPLVLENHPTLLFVNSGMVQLTPYFLGEKDAKKDFKNNMLVDTQKSIRTGDLDIVGKSKYHHTFFEMLGSWSIGAYGKEKAVELAFDLLTNKEYGFGLDKDKLIPTVFGGSDEVGEDSETIKAWQKVGIKKISKLPASENWWSPGGLTGPGPCGPCTEVLYDRGKEFGEEEETPGLTDNPRYLEVWNAGVFMSYNRKEEGGKLTELKMKSVDTGAGLERITALLQGVDNNYETDLFKPIIESIKSIGDFEENEETTFALRRCADHIKASCFLVVENVFPSNKDQGYVLRRLMRTVFNDFVWTLNIEAEKIPQVIASVINIYKDVFSEIDNLEQLTKVFEEEIKTYSKIANNTKNYINRTYVNKGLKTIENPFDIYQSTGASKELIADLAKELGLSVNFKNFEANLKRHQELSRNKSADKFKGGLAGASDKEKNLHTATHLLHQALRDTLGDHVQQMGSNINPERLRFDFSNDEKVNEQDLKKIEGIVNAKIKEGLPVNMVEMSLTEAEKTGALHFFKEKYGDTVSIYYIGKNLDSAYSKEFCGGPHAKNTSELGQFKILKEESVAKGVRRIKATLN